MIQNVYNVIYMYNMTFLTNREPLENFPMVNFEFWLYILHKENAIFIISEVDVILCLVFFIGFRLRKHEIAFNRC